jgi:hypothetical protein
VAGGQALGDNVIDSKIVQLQPFIQLLAGLSQMPSSFSATMVVQFSAGAQLTLKFGPITIQLSAGVQITGQQGQGVQPSLAFQAMVGPSNPAPGTGAQSFGPRNNWASARRRRCPPLARCRRSSPLAACLIPGRPAHLDAVLGAHRRTRPRRRGAEFDVRSRDPQIGITAQFQAAYAPA